MKRQGKENGSMPRSDMVQSLLKALDLLRAVAESPDGLRLNELAERFSMSKSTVHNLLRTLRARGFLEQDAAGRWSTGPAVQELASLQAHSLRLERAAGLLPALKKHLPASATVTVSELTPGGIYCRLRLSPERPGELQRPINRTLQPYLTVTALCLQSTSPNAAEFERLYPYSEFGAAKWGDLESYLRKKQTVREQKEALLCTDRELMAAFPFADDLALGIHLEEADPGQYLPAIRSLVKKLMGEPLK